MSTKAFLVIVLFLLVGIFGYLLGVSSERASIGARSETRSISTEEVLTKWVFDRSSKISIDTSRTIVKEAMKTERPLLILALISVESEFVPNVVSHKGAQGLTQIMPIHEKDLIKAGIIKNRRDLFNIAQSVRAGNFILNECLKQSNGDLPRALEKYLGGKDGFYIKRILENVGNLYILTGEQK